jgi:hypothetical protein
MADETRMALAELLRKADAAPELDVLREGARLATTCLTHICCQAWQPRMGLVVVAAFTR